MAQAPFIVLEPSTSSEIFASPIFLVGTGIAVLASCAAFVAIILRITTCYHQDPENLSVASSSRHGDGSFLSSAVTHSSSNTNTNKKRILSVYPHLKFNLLSCHRCPLRTDDTPSLVAVASCCIARVRQRLGLDGGGEAGGARLHHRRRGRENNNSGSSTTTSTRSTANSRLLYVESSLVLMRHFERVDHIDSGWYTHLSKIKWNDSVPPKCAADGYCPLDPPLSKAGIRDGIDFSSQLQRRISKGGRPEDRFTLVVTSPALRCVQTAVLVAAALQVPIAVDEALGDWINRRVFGASITKKPELSLVRQQSPSISAAGVTKFWLHNQAAKHCTFYAQDVFVANRDILVNHCGVQESLDGSLGFHSVDDFLEELDCCCCDCCCRHDDDNSGSSASSCFEDNTTAALARQKRRDEIKQRRSNKCHKNISCPEPERDFSDRVTSAIDFLSQSIVVNHSSTKTSPSQKVFTGDQLLRNEQQCCSCSCSSAAADERKTEAASRSSSNKNKNPPPPPTLGKYGPRLLLVTHADVIRVAAEELAPRCSEAPSARDGISVPYGALTNLVRIGHHHHHHREAAEDEEEKQQQQESSSSSVNNYKFNNSKSNRAAVSMASSECCSDGGACYHLANFGSRTPAALDVPTLVLNN